MWSAPKCRGLRVWGIDKSMYSKREVLTMCRWIVPICVAALGGMCGGVTGDGMIFPNPPRPDQPFTVSYHRVECGINNQVAKTTIDQAFRNDTDAQLEGTYIFPIPTDAAVDQFAMWADGKKLTGEVLSRDEARRIYESIVRTRRDPALLEYVDQGLFRARVFPLPPKQDKKIELKYTQVLKQNGEIVKYVYPLSVERFSNRPIKNVTITVDITDKSPIRNVYSPTHDIAVHRDNDRHVSVSFEENDSLPNTDFVLYYSLSRDDVGLSLFTYKEGGGDGFFMLLASPTFDVPKERILPKDVVFVLDRTGSMAGEKIQQAKGAFRFCLDNLNAGDRFNVLAFNDAVDPCFGDKLVKAESGNVAEARQYVERLSANGGTNINEAMLRAVSLFGNGEGRMRVVVFLTDGLPTVGVTDTSTILANVKEKNGGRIRTFVFGVGYDVNVHFLDKLAEGARGAAEYVRPSEDIEVPVSNLYAKLANPILANVRIDIDGVDVYEWYPQELPDLFRGSQIIVLGRYRGSGIGTLHLVGSAGRERKTFSLEHNFSRNESQDYIPRLWAARKIGYLLDEIRLHGQNKELIDEIVRLSKTYGIITEYTSYLVNEDELRRIVEVNGGDYTRVLNEDAALNLTKNQEQFRLGDVASERFSQAGEVEGGAYGVAQSQQAAKLRGGAGGANYGMKDRAARAYGPGAAVDMSNAGLNTRALQQSVSRSGEWVEIQNLKQVGNRTFYQRGGQWVDDRVPPNAQTTKIQQYSDAYFQIAAYNKDVAQYLAVGENALFVYNGNVIQVGSDGRSEKFTDAELRTLLSEPKTGSDPILRLAPGGEDVAGSGNMPFFVALGLVGVIGGGSVLVTRRTV
jgi:Ca-activated chloride channel family protein